MAFADIVVKIGADLKDFQKKMQDVESKMGAMGSKVSGAGQAMASTFGAAGLAIGAGLGFAVNKSADFESQLSRVGAISGASGKELDALRGSALDLGASTSKSASEVAVAQEGLAALGMTATDIIAAMPGVISAAESSGADMATTADTMASALNIFGLEAGEASRVADVLAQTANVSAADITDMQYALKYSGPVAANLGVSLEELSASIGIMTNAGLDGSSAGTSLRAGLLALLKPSEENSKMMESMGIQMTDANGKFVGIKGVIEQLNGSMEGMTEAQKTATLASLVGTEASSGFLSLMSAGPGEIDKMTTSLENSGGASEEAAGKMKDNLKGALEELGGAFETAQISIGTALTPAIQKVASVIQSLVDKFNGLSPSMQKFIAIGAAVAAIFLLIMAAIGVALVVIGSVITAISSIAAVVVPIISAFGGVLAILTGPIGLIVAAIAALIAIGIALWKNWDTVAEYASQIWARIKEIFFASVSAVKTFLVNGFRSAVEGAKAVWSTIVSFFISLWANIKTTFSTALSAVVAFVQARFGFLISATKTIFANYINIFKNVWNIIKNVFLGALLVIVTLIRGDFGKARSYIVQIMGNIRSSLSSIWNSIKNIVKAAVNALKQAAINAFNNLKSGAINAVNALKSGVVNGFNSAKSLAISAVNALKSGAVNAFNAMKSAISSAMGRVKSAIVDGWNSAKSFLTNIDLGSIGKNIIQGLIGGITSMVGAVGKAIKGVADKVTGGIAKLLDVHSPSRVMMKLGGYTGEGFAKGITQSESMVAKAVNGMGNVAINGVASTSRSRGTYNLDSGRESVMETNVYLDSKQIGRGVQRVIDNGQRQKLNVRTAVSGVRT